MSKRKANHRTTTLPVLTAALLMFGCRDANAIERPWERTNWHGRLNLPAQAVKDGRVFFVRFDLEKLRSRDAARIEFPLPDGKFILINRTAEERLKSGGYIWRGKVDGDVGSDVTLSILDNTLVGSVILSNGQMYRVDQVSNDVQIIFQLNPRAFGPEAQPLKVNIPDVPKPIRMEEMSCPQDTIEMLVVYTEAACAASFVGGGDTCSTLARTIIKNRIDTAEAQTKSIFQNSLINAQISVVAVRSAGDYSDDAETLQVNLERLELSADEEKSTLNVSTAYLDDVHNWRNEVRADVVSLITKPKNAYDNPATEADETAACGQSTLMTKEADLFEKYAFTVVPVDCMLESHSFGHELGHIMGADHDKDSSPSKSDFIGNRGFLHFNTPTPWMTVMAENFGECEKASPEKVCLRIPYFSSADTAVKYLGDAVGSTEANNRGVVSETVDTVSRYRRSLSCGGN